MKPLATARPYRGRPSDELDEGIARMQRMLDLGRWPSGLRLTVEDRELVEWNLELARTERRERDARP